MQKCKDCESSKLCFLDENWSWDVLTLDQFIKEKNYPIDWEYFFEKNLSLLNKISNQLPTEIIIYPPIYKIFRAFISLEKIRLVIIGQDPYHNGSATGLCFSVRPGNAINPSLRNIYTELKKEGFSPEENGDLSHWAVQGCFLLNSALTVEKGNPGEHIGIWYEFTEKVIRSISEQSKGIAWLLMGNNALQFEYCIDKTRHVIFGTSHPSPFSAYNSLREYPAFIGSGVFKKINDFLGEKRIDW